MNASAIELARQLAALTRRLEALERAPRLRNASLEDTPLNVYGTDGALKQRIGPQADGTYTTVDHNGPVPPSPTVPVLEARDGVLVVTWDGRTEDGVPLPLDFARVEVHVSTNPSFVPTDLTQVQEFTSNSGGSVTLSLAPDTYYARLVMVSTSLTESVPSAKASADVTAIALSSSDGHAPTSSPTPIVHGGIGTLFITWAEVDNADPVTYDIYLSKASGFSPSAATFVASVAGGTGPIVVRALTDGTALAAGTSYYVRIVARDEDDAADPGAETSGTPVQVASIDVAKDAITARQIAAGAVTEAALALDAVTSSKIADGAVVVGSNTTTFEAGYDPTTKETPAGAQAKADAAAAAAAADAKAKADAAQAAATAAAAADAKAKADAAQAAATAAAATTAQAKADAAKADAIAAASSDAQAKADAAKADATAAAAITAQAKADAAAAQAKADAVAAAAADATAKANAAQSAAISAAAADATAKADVAYNRWAPTGQTTIDGGKITADSIMAAQIHADAVTANKIAAGAVTAEKLTIGSLGSTLIRNGSFEEVSSADTTMPAGWTKNEVWGGSNPALTTASPITGTRSMALPCTSTTASQLTSVGFPVVPGQIIAVRFKAKSSGGTLPGFYARLLGGTSPTDLGVNPVGPLENVIVPTTVTDYAPTFTVPAGMTWAHAVFLNKGVASGGAQTITVDDVSVQQVIISAQIADGAITTDKILAGAIKAGKIDAGVVTATELATGAVTADKIYANAVTAGKIAAYAVSADSLAANIVLSSTIATGASGQDRVVLDANGIQVLKADNSQRAVLPTNPANPVFIKGTAELDSAVINDKLTLRGTNNAIAPGTTFQLQGAVQDPQSQVSVTTDWETVQTWADPTSFSYQIRGLDFDNGGYHYANLFFGTQIMAYNEAGAFAGNVGLPDNPIGSNYSGTYQAYGGVVKVGNFYFTAGTMHRVSDNKNVWQIRKWTIDFTATTYTFVGYADIGIDTVDYNGSGTNPILGKGPGGLYLAWWGGNPDGTFTLHSDAINTSTLALGGAGTNYGGSVTAGNIGDVLYFEQGTFDYGSARTIFAYKAGGSGAQVVRVFNGTTLQPQDEFRLPAGTVGICYNPTAVNSFRSMQASGSHIFSIKHSLINWNSTITTSDTWWGTFTYRNGTNADETAQSVYKSFPFEKRQRITMTTPAIPPGGTGTDPDRVRMWVGQGAAQPARTAMWTFATPAAGVITAIQNTQVLGSPNTNPPAVNNFPASALSKILDASGNPLVDSTGVVGSATSTVVKGKEVWAGTFRLDTPPHFHGSLINVSQPVTVNTVVPFGPIYDPSNLWDNTNKRWTVPVPGVYRITFQFKVNGTAAAPVHQIRGGAAGTTVRYWQPNVPSAAFGGGNFTWEGALAAGDLINLFCTGVGYTTQPDGTGVDNNYMTIDWVRP